MESENALTYERLPINILSQKLLEKYNKCPLLEYQLYKRGILVFEEIKPFIRNGDSIMLSNYLWKEINDFENSINSKFKSDDFAESFSRMKMKLIN